MRAAVLAVLAVLSLAGCKDKPAPAPAPAPAASAPNEPDPAASARRPARHYYLVHAAKGCEVYFIDPSTVSPPISTPCPADLLVGERIRLAGKTCMREGGEADRIEPVVCPDPLTNLEKAERGESH